MVETRMDQALPVVKEMIIPYMVCYVIPSTYVMASIVGKGVKDSVANVRLFYTVQISLMVTCYALYILFPVSIRSIAIEKPSDNVPLLLQLTYTFVHTGMTTFCAFPSMHVAHCTSMAWIQWEERLPGAAWTCAVAVVTLFSTVLTKAHFIMDVPSGLLMAYLFHRFMWKPLRANGKLAVPSKPSERMSTRNRCICIFAGPGVMLAVALWLIQYTGSTVDIVSMFSGRECKRIE
jgi:membrane-associated phospholipid phosphatase